MVCSSKSIYSAVQWMGYYVLMLIATCRYSHWPLKQLSTFDESLRRHTQAPVRSHVAKLIPWVNATTLTLLLMHRAALLQGNVGEKKRFVFYSSVHLDNKFDSSCNSDNHKYNRIKTRSSNSILNMNNPFVHYL